MDNDAALETDIALDVGNLLMTNNAMVSQSQLKDDDSLRSFTQRNVQHLLESLFRLPTERIDDVKVVCLPEGTTVLPREKKIPKAKAPTKWESYAKAKGIISHKKPAKVFDEASKEWKPRWGYKRTNDNTKDWCIEVPANADPMEDQFAQRTAAKSERTAKNEFQRLKNIARASKVNLSGVLPVTKPSKDSLHRALTIAKKSTASLGKHTVSVAKETPAKHVGKKRKFEGNHLKIKDEQSRQLVIISKVLNKKPRMDVDKAVNKEIRSEQLTRREERREGMPRKQRVERRSKAGSKGSGKKPSFPPNKSKQQQKHGRQGAGSKNKPSRTK